MLGRLRSAAHQLSWLAADVKRMNGDAWWRWPTFWTSEAFATLANYRVNRAAHLALGPGWSVARTALSPLRFAARPWLGRCDISYLADIGPGLRILHGSLGITISSNAVIGKNFIATGGNCIGLRRAGELRIGDDVQLGASATVIGPLTIGDSARIGANALVTSDVPAGATMLAPVAVPRAP